MHTWLSLICFIIFTYNITLHPQGRPLTLRELIIIIPIWFLLLYLVYFMFFGKTQKEYLAAIWIVRIGIIISIILITLPLIFELFGFFGDLKLTFGGLGILIVMIIYFKSIKVRAIEKNLFL